MTPLSSDPRRVSSDPCPKPASTAAGFPAGMAHFCGSCRSWLPVTEFGADAGQPSGHAKSCRDCRRREYLRNRAQCRLRDAKNHQSRRADDYRARFEALLSALPDFVLDRLPKPLQPTPMQRRVARAAHRKRIAGLPVTY